MSWDMLLAAASQTTNSGQDVQVVPVDFIWEQITSLSWFQAVMGISFGIVYLLYGWRIFRVLVVVCFAMVGMFLGILMGQRLGGQSINQIWGGVLGLIAFAVLAVPLMKWCVSILGAAAGGILTASLWYAFGLPQEFIWAGAIIGIVAGGLMSFILLKISVMLFTCLGGSAVVAVCMLALIHIYETKILQTSPGKIHEMVFQTTWFLPVCLIVPTLIGIFVQNKFIKHSNKWDFES